MRTAKSEDLIPINIKLNDYLNRSISAFSEMCNIPVTFFDYSHRLIQEYNASEKICNFFNIYCDTCGPCRQRLAEAGDFSAKVEEPYVFFCKGKEMEVELDQRFFVYVMGEITVCVSVGIIE